MTLKRPSHALTSPDGCAPNEQFTRAKAEAEAWFVHMGRGGSSRAHTVAEAVGAYVAHLRSERGDSPANDAQSRLHRLVLKDAKLAAMDVGKLTHAHVNAWRVTLLALEKEASTTNRDMTAFRAVLNHALHAGWVTTDGAWSRALLALTGADNRREVYLDRDQRRKLVEHCPPDMRALVQCWCMLPLRPGAAARLKARDFDPVQGRLIVKRDKAGKGRHVPLPPNMVDFFKVQAKNKLPSAPLLARPDGKAWDKDYWKELVKAAVRSAGLPDDAVAMSLRHSAITDLITEGLDVLTVSHLSGTSIAMIQKHYGHLVDTRARDALAKLMG
ncbi:MAG: tyrosine-type recombinase/integrase [Burkholderiaceae bacterium]